MSAGNENQDFDAMKKLLTAWHVGILYDLFKQEEITVNELKMMQLSHIYDLLKQHKMGVKIRFEYHLNSWRNKIGMPLRTVDCGHHHVICHNCNGNTRYNSMDAPPIDTVKKGNKKRRLNQNIPELNENQSPLSPQSVNSNDSLVNMLNSNEIVNFMPATLLESPSKRTHNSDDEAEMENLPLNTLSDILSDSVNDTPPKFPSKPSLEKCSITLQQILDKSGSRGNSIVAFFNDKNRLTNIHRSQLIQTIVDFFDENDYHLSLNMSHNLEWEILKMFPTEKLENYRTGKRGKIYVKFSNMKRYKRERNNKVRNEMEMNVRSRRSLGISDCNSVRYVENKDDEDWYAEPEILVKEENLSDNELKFN